MFFGKEYQALKVYVNSRIADSTDRDAEDVIQDVALKLFSGADRYSAINNVAGFVYHSIKNKIIDIMRTSRQKQKSGKNLENKLAEVIDFEYEDSYNLYSETLIDELKKAVFNLKPEYRDIILAIDFEGYSYSEISLVTGIPKGTLMSRHHRAISLLHKTLNHKKEI